MAKKSRVKRFLVIAAACIGFIVILAFVAFQVSPWPSALMIRYSFDKDGKKVNELLKKHVPEGVSVITNQQYINGDKDARLDVYYPTALSGTEQVLPVIVWVHGGGWIAGNKDYLSNYCKILAAKGFCVIATEYSIAPEKNYPLPLIQTNKALAYINQNAKRFHADPSNFVLAGDSGGAHIVAQIGNIISDGTYANLVGITPEIRRDQLAGLLLYCGPYDAQAVDKTGAFGLFLKTVLWSYSGKKDYESVPGFNATSVINYITKDYPPCFVSAGNGDPLLSQSLALAKKLGGLGIKMDTLFFSPNHSPALPHEYQFNLDNNSGELALERSVKFLKKVTTK